ncbi:hypothetical protein KSS87_002300 [Heliosperma pusillum]|nr:hypothetical protein KSS87_002300 [Heliosperma pusillum]
MIYLLEQLSESLESERQRADEWERKYTEAHESNEEKRKKLEETERRVHQLQDSLNRMISCMSDQFSELKMILHGSKSGCASEYTVRDTRDDVLSSSSDESSSDSDLSFSALASTSTNLSFLNPDALKLITEDLSHADTAGSVNWESDQEGAFNDFF